jgi:hypothetical protein
MQQTSVSDNNKTVNEQASSFSELMIVIKNSVGSQVLSMARCVALLIHCSACAPEVDSVDVSG